MQPTKNAQAAAQELQGGLYTSLVKALRTNDLQALGCVSGIPSRAICLELAMLGVGAEWVPDAPQIASAYRHQVIEREG
jgi:hypothetical protein